MTGKPSNAREALLAELLGDVQALLSRLEQADQSAKATAAAVTDATAQYRGQMDELVSRLRAETASLVLKTTEHAAQTLVAQQQATLQAAATRAMNQALGKGLAGTVRRGWLVVGAVGGVAGCLATLLLQAAQRLFAG